MDKEDVACVYNGILLSHKKNEVMQFVITWMELKIIILNEVNQKKDKYHITALICGIWHPKWLSGKEFACLCRRFKRLRFDPWVGKLPWQRNWQPTPVFLPGESSGQRSLVGYSPWSCKESDTTEHKHTYVESKIQYK